MPLGDSYWHVPCLSEWFRNRAVYGKSGLPWSSERYKGRYKGTFDLPNIKAVETCHMTLGIHEGCGPREVQDLVEAVAKAEKAYLR